MGQNFLLSPAARSLRVHDVARMSEADAWEEFVRLRFAATGGRPCCPCGCDTVYLYRCRKCFKCQRCGKQFSATSGTVFAFRKLSFQTMLLAIAYFVVPRKGHSALHLSLELGVQYKTAFVLAHKMREAMANENANVLMSGEVEIDGTEIGGYIKPKNVKKTAKDHRKFPYRSEKKQVVTAVVERNGRAKTFVARTESQGVDFVLGNIKRGSKVYADSAACWNIVEAYFETARINHKQVYHTPDASTNSVECFNSLFKRNASGIHHKVAGFYLSLYASDCAWRWNKRRQGTRARFEQLCCAVAGLGQSIFRGYWQRHRKQEKIDVPTAG